MTLSSRTTSLPTKLVLIFLLTSTLLSCKKEAKLLPGEAEFLAVVEPAEQMIADMGDAKPNAVQCKQLKQSFDDGVKAFKVLMPQLKGLSLRKRDARLGAIRESYEGRC